MKYRNKPIVIESMQLTWQNWNDICEFVPKPFFQRGCYVHPEKDEEIVGNANARIGLIMQTQNTEHFLAVENDWICKGINGEFYPCKPDIFSSAYEEVLE